MGVPTLCDWRILQGDALAVLRGLESESVHCVISSPPYWGLRDYGVSGQIGLEPSPSEYVSRLVEVFREVRRVLREDGTLWLNLGDSYAKKAWLSGGAKTEETARRARDSFDGRESSLKPKDLIGIPWMVAFALRADGWWLRSDVVWHKPNPMPESVSDRPTRAHEFIFLLTKSERYFYDAAAIREPCVYGDHPRNGTPDGQCQAPGQPRQTGISRIRTSGNKARKYRSDFGGNPESGAGQAFAVPWEDLDGRRNKRDVWSVGSHPFPEAHFATFPEALILPCVLAGTSELGCCPECGGPVHRKEVGDRISGSWTACECGERPTPVPCVVLDPFAGASTTGVVALKNGRSFVGIELNPEYVTMSERRLGATAPLFSRRAVP